MTFARPSADRRTESCKRGGWAARFSPFPRGSRLRRTLAIYARRAPHDSAMGLAPVLQGLAGCRRHPDCFTGFPVRRCPGRADGSSVGRSLSSVTVMRSPRPVTAFIALLLLFQSMGLGSGVLSASSSAADCAATMASMADVSGPEDMDGMPMSPAAPSSRGPEAPCGLPWALGCTSAAACIPLGIPTEVASAAGNAPGQARISAAYTARPASLVRAPEPPPPRG